MNKYEVILGVDVSKLTLDISYADRHLHLKISNDNVGFNDLKKWCKLNKIDLATTFIVMEHSGGYEYRFIQFCESASIDYCRVSPLEIKKSLGMTRGKNDKVDSFRISQYGEEKIKRLNPDRPLDGNIILLRQLLSYCKRLVRENAGLAATIKERNHMYHVHKKTQLFAFHRIK